MIAGPFKVVTGEVHTGIRVRVGDAVGIVSSGHVAFGGLWLGVAAPILDAEGDSVPASPRAPAPALRRFSLICRVGATHYQGGRRAVFTAAEDGELVLVPNDEMPAANRDGWYVLITLPAMSARGRSGGGAR